MNTQPTAQQATLQSFDRFLATHENGDLNADLTKILNEMVAAMNNHVIDHGGKPKGEISLKMKFQLEGGIFHCEADIDHKVPKAPRNAGVYFSTDKNMLTKRDPRQHEMFTDVNNSRGAAAITL